MTIDWPSFTLGVVALFALSTVTVAWFYNLLTKALESC